MQLPRTRPKHSSRVSPVMTQCPWGHLPQQPSAVMSSCNEGPRSLYFSSCVICAIYPIAQAFRELQKVCTQCTDPHAPVSLYVFSHLTIPFNEHLLWTRPNAVSGCAGMKGLVPLEKMSSHLPLASFVSSHLYQTPYSLISPSHERF